MLTCSQVAFQPTGLLLSYSNQLSSNRTKNTATNIVQTQWCMSNVRADLLILKKKHNRWYQNVNCRAVLLLCIACRDTYKWEMSGVCKNFKPLWKFHTSLKNLNQFKKIQTKEKISTTTYIMSIQSEMSESVANLYFTGSTGQQQNLVQRPAQGFAQQPKGKVLCEWRGT